MIELSGPLSNSIDRTTSQFAQLRTIRDRIAQLDPLVFGSDTTRRCVIVSTEVCSN